MIIGDDGWRSDNVKIIEQRDGEYVMLTLQPPTPDRGWLAQAERASRDHEQLEFSGLLVGGDSLAFAKAVAEKAAEKLID